MPLRFLVLQCSLRLSIEIIWLIITEQLKSALMVYLDPLVVFRCTFVAVNALLQSFRSKLQTPKCVAWIRASGRFLNPQLLPSCSAGSWALVLLVTPHPVHPIDHRNLGELHLPLYFSLILNSSPLGALTKTRFCQLIEPLWGLTSDLNIPAR